MRYKTVMRNMYAL